MIYVVKFNYYKDDGRLEWWNLVYSTKDEVDIAIMSNMNSDLYAHSAEVVETAKTPKTKKDWIAFINNRSWHHNDPKQADEGGE
jgi:hypothetical protein